MIWTIEVAGRPIQAVAAGTLAEARKLTTEEWFISTLAFEDSAGRPVWDGRAPISVREAIRPEIKVWDLAVEGTVRAGDLAGPDAAATDGFNAWLIPVRVPE
jgi:hypothetical protein